MTPPTSKPTLGELFDLPEHVGANDFVLKLTEAIARPETTVKDYVVTDQLRHCFDDALALVKDAIGTRRSTGAYLHGSFGTGKSHFMAMLYLLLSNDTRARSMPDLAEVVAKHEWTAGKKFLLVPYHMIGADTVEERVLGGYLDRMRELHPDAAPPGLYDADSMMGNALKLRQQFGDEAFFRALNESPMDDGWGDAARWDAESFETAAKADARSRERSELIGALAHSLMPGARHTVATVDLDTGLALISQHAKSLGYDAVILFLDELILWLASRAADAGWLTREGPKLAKLVESGNANRPVPIISFVARQRAIRELIGKAGLGANQALVDEALEWWEKRFSTITLEDKNLATIARRRLLKPKNEAARQLIEAEFSGIGKLGNSVIDNGTGGYSGDNGLAINAQFQTPGGIALDFAGDLYIADTDNRRVRKVSKGLITTIVGDGNPTCCFFPHAIAIDADGSLYITDIMANRVRKFANGALTDVAGTGGRGFSGDNGLATSAEFDSPNGVAVDRSGNLYITDMDNYRVRKVSKGVITTVAGNGTKALSETEALTAPLAPEISDAYNLLQGKYEDGFIPDTAVNSILAELRAIRTAKPELAKVYDFGHFDLRELLVSAHSLMPTSLSPQQQQALYKRIISTPLSTGIKKLDELNKKFGAVKIDGSLGDGDDGFANIHFRKPLDIGRVAEIYSEQFGPEVQPNFFYGDGNRVRRTQNGGSIHYVFAVRGGDCPAGCTEETVYYLNLHPDGQGYRIDRVDGPQPYHSLWGYPERFPVRIFESFDDLVKQTESTDWSMRLHAVAALGRVYATGGSGLDEDVFASRDEDPAVVKRTAAIIDQIKKSPDAVKGLLERIAAHDSDDDVRRTAKTALRAHEQLSRKQ
jgi:hypothetical protein